MGETGNRILMAVLLGVFVVTSVSFANHFFFHKAEYEKISLVGPPPVIDNSPSDICPLLATADISVGESIAKANCTSCHNFNTETNGTGPHLVGIVGRDVAGVDFSYSSAMQSVAGEWNLDELNGFLFAPGAYVPGTKMNFGGWDNSKTKQRANVIAYLYAQSGVELPTCPAVEEGEEAAAS